MSLPDGFLQELKIRSDIVDVVSPYVSLRRRGKNMVGLCPFHGEKTPSFNLYPENGSFYCFGCGAGGDVITFIRKIENLDYMESVKFLAERAGLDMPENSYDQGLSSLRARVYEVNREAARFFYKNLYTQNGKAALDYLTNRGLKDSTIKHFGLGYAPDSRFTLVNYLREKGYKDNEMLAANLAVKSQKGATVDRFWNRVMFPIIDLRGNVIAFGGRIMGDFKPKYLNTSDTIVFKKSNNLFALNMAKNTSKRQLILAEGYMDVIALHQAGFQNAVATLGTAITAEQAVLIKRYADEVVISYDADQAGKKAAERAISLLRNAGLLIRVLSIPGAKDPDEFIKMYKDSGPARFKQLIERSGNDVEYRLASIKADYDLTHSEGKVAYLTEACKILATLENDIEREIYASKLSEEVGVGKDSVLNQTKKLFNKNKREYVKKEFRNIQAETSAIQDRINPQKASNLRGAKAEEGIIAYLINNPDMVNKILEKLPNEKMLTDFNKRLYQVVTNRLIEGKPALPMDISQFFSPEENSRIAKILHEYSSVEVTKTVAAEYINTILSENDKLSMGNMVNASDDDIRKMLGNLKKEKQ